MSIHAFTLKHDSISYHIPHLIRSIVRTLENSNVKDTKDLTTKNVIKIVILKLLGTSGLNKNIHSYTYIRNLRIGKT